MWENFDFFLIIKSDFKDVETQELGYKVLIEAFARTHNLSCVPVDTKLGTRL